MEFRIQLDLNSWEALLLRKSFNICYSQFRTCGDRMFDACSCQTEIVTSSLYSYLVHEGAHARFESQADTINHS